MLIVISNKKYILYLIGNCTFNDINQFQVQDREKKQAFITGA